MLRCVLNNCVRDRAVRRFMGHEPTNLFNCGNCGLVNRRNIIYRPSRCRTWSCLYACYIFNSGGGCFNRCTIAVCLWLMGCRERVRCLFPIQPQLGMHGSRATWRAFSVHCRDTDRHLLLHLTHVMWFQSSVWFGFQELIEPTRQYQLIADHIFKKHLSLNYRCGTNYLINDLINARYGCEQL